MKQAVTVILVLLCGFAGISFATPVLQQQLPLLRKSRSTLETGGNAQTAASFECSRPLRLIMTGPPAAGKGTQCAFLSSQYNLVHLSTGDMLRSEIRRETPLGLKIKTQMNQGSLVDDSLITELVHRRLQNDDCRSCGWILDGFPRTMSQAAALEQLGHEPDCIVNIEVSQQETLSRISQRRIDPITGKIYHLQHMPPPAATAASASGDGFSPQQMVQRSDDVPEIAVKRFQDYLLHIEAVREYYKRRLVHVDGTRDVNEVSEMLKEVVDGILGVHS